MKPYLDKALQQFNIVVPTKLHYSPYPHVEPKYEAKQQFAKYDESEPVDDKRRKFRKSLKFFYGTDTGLMA
jgi:hypothetical protein